MCIIYENLDAQRLKLKLENGSQAYYEMNMHNYSQKYWRKVNLAVGANVTIAKNIGGFKFGSVRDRSTYIC